MSGGEQFFDVGRDGTAFFFHALDGCWHAGGIPEFEGTEFPVEAHAHGAIDFDDGVRNFGDAVRRIGPQFGERSPQEGCGLVGLLRGAIEAEQHADARASLLDILGHIEGGEFRLLAGMVFQGLPVERHALVFLAGGFHLLIEAAFGFVAQPFALDHLAEEGRDLQFAALIAHVLCHVADDVAEDVESDEVDGAEGGGAWPADGLSCQRVNFFDAQIHLLHEADDVEHGESADAIGDEVGRVLGEDDPFAELDIAEVDDGIDEGAIGFGSGNQFEQAHVARRIEEVGTEPGAAEVLGKSFSDFRYRQAAGIGSDDDAGLADCFDLLEEAALDFEVLDDRFDDPVDVGKAS